MTIAAKPLQRTVRTSKQQPVTQENTDTIEHKALSSQQNITHNAL